MQKKIASIEAKCLIMCKEMNSRGTHDQGRAGGGDGINTENAQFLGRGYVVDRPRMPFVTRIHDLPGNLVRNVLV